MRHLRKAPFLSLTHTFTHVRTCRGPFPNRCTHPRARTHIHTCAETKAVSARGCAYFGCATATLTAARPVQTWDGRHGVVCHAEPAHSHWCAGSCWSQLAMHPRSRGWKCVPDIPGLWWHRHRTPNATRWCLMDEKQTTVVGMLARRRGCARCGVVWCGVVRARDTGCANVRGCCLPCPWFPWQVCHLRVAVASKHHAHVLRRGAVFCRD